MNFGSSNQCYANGVKVLNALAGMMLIARTMKADGTVCLTTEAGFGGGGRGGMMGAPGISYRGPDGTVVATGALQQNGQIAVTCTGSTVPQIVPSNCHPGLNVASGFGRPGGGGGGAATACTQGMCQ